jgi:hypothetical protein
MIHEKITGVTQALRSLGGHVHESVWELLRVACAELDDAAEAAKNLENMLPIAGTGEAAQHAPAQA